VQIEIGRRHYLAYLLLPHPVRMAAVLALTARRRDDGPR
jgi:hypothetical protein